MLREAASSGWLHTHPHRGSSAASSTRDACCDAAAAASSDAPPARTTARCPANRTNAALCLSLSCTPWPPWPSIQSQVWQYYHDRRLQAEAGCSAEGGASCEVLDSLEKLVYEVACTGDAEQLYHVLKVGVGVVVMVVRGAALMLVYIPQA